LYNQFKNKETGNFDQQGLWQMFESIVPDKAAETMAVFGRGKMLPSLEMTKEEAREH